MKATFAALFVSATVLAAPALLSEMVSLPRVAYILGRWFDGPHDGYRGRCSGAHAESPTIDGHESVSVAVTCGYETSLSSVIAGLDWVVDTAASDATVVVPDHLRGHRAVEDRLDSMRECGMNVPAAFMAPQSPSRESMLPAFAMGFAACSCFLTACALARSLIRRKAPGSPMHRRHTWDMTARDRRAWQAGDQEAARARREFLAPSWA